MSRRQSVRVVLAEEAEGDLQAIYNQRLAQRGAEGVDGADALLDSLIASMESLIDFPLRGPIPPELEAIGIADWRQLSVAPYRIIYTAAADQVTIAVIADGRRDFASLLERRLLQKASRT
jgi:plasmid stabilization system protein ParE